MKIHIIEPIVAPENEDHKIERMLEVAGPGTEMKHIFIPEGPRVIESEYEDALAVPATVRLAEQAEKEGADAIVINCTADTGLGPCRERVSIPVVAPTLAAMHLAAQLSHHFSILTFLERVNQRFEEMAWRWGFGHKLASVRSVETPVADLLKDEDKLARDLFEASKVCYEQDGAHAIILGCTDFELVADRVQELLDEAGIPIPLLRPYEIAVRQAEALVSMGIGHSKLTYPDVNID